jgi:hypothetical protein
MHSHSIALREGLTTVERRYNSSAMTHPARTTLAALSLLLGGAAAMACVISYIRPAGITRTHAWCGSDGQVWNSQETTVINAGGKLCLRRVTTRLFGRPPLLSDHCEYEIGQSVAANWPPGIWVPYKRETGAVRFGWDMESAKTARFRDTYWTLPLPLLVLLFGILPVRWAILRRRERRRNAAKVCVRCGYDLRGTSSGRCSE